MALVGPLCFCTDCGNLLDRPTDPQQRQIACDLCATLNDSRYIYSFSNVFTHDCLDKWPPKQISQSQPGAFPSALQRRLRTHTQEVPQGLEVGTNIRQACPNCPSEEMVFTEAQLRGADEGTTIFFRCLQCNYRYNSNN